MILACLKCNGEGRLYFSPYGGNDPDPRDDGECDACEGSGTARCDNRGCTNEAFSFDEDGRALCQDCLEEWMIDYASTEIPECTRKSRKNGPYSRDLLRGHAMKDTGALFIERKQEGLVRVTCRSPDADSESAVEIPRREWLALIEPDAPGATRDPGPLVTAAQTVVDAISMRQLKSPADCKILAVLREALAPFAPKRIGRMPKGQCAYCDAHQPNEMMPSHTPSERCESGKRPHCTCDICF